ncbi:MAG: hypothetical protein ACPLKV_00370 [Minisyncoccia bacterium]
MSQLMDKGTGIVCFLLAVWQKQYPQRKIGRIILQKLLFLFAQRQKYEWGYHLNHLGPTSELVDLFLSWAENRQYVRLERKNGACWVVFQEVSSEIFDCLSQEDKVVIREIVEKFGCLRSEELVVTTTALYMEQNYKIEDKKMIIDLILESRPTMVREEVKKLVNLVL